MTNLIARLRGLDPRVMDATVTVLLLLLCVPESIVFAEGPGNKAALAALGVLALATVYWRRTKPVITILSLSGFFIVVSATNSDFFNKLTSPFLALMITLYSLGRYAPELLAKVGLVTLIASATASTVMVGNVDPAQVLWLFVLGVGPFLVGRAMRTRTLLQVQLIEATEELERDREQVARRAVGDERARIAGELQAVVANGVSAMVVQAEGIPRVLATGEKARAEHALAVIEETGRDALAEMRRLLGVLRRDGEEPSLAPLPTLAEVERLAGRQRGDGLVVALGFEGERIQLPPGADLAAYRVLEEALDAAGSGGASVADILIGFGSDELRLDVSDDRADAGVDPEPLLAMRERLGLYGGRVRAGKADDGLGFRVTARLPLNGSAA